VELKQGWQKPAALVNLKKVKGLDKIRFTKKEGLRIGAMVTWAQLLDSKTLAGNISQASPAANGPLPLLVYDARCVIQGTLCDPGNQWGQDHSCGKNVQRRAQKRPEKR
jgi:CO/xanthine dehydrogenase FAD-binding subunit